MSVEHLLVRKSLNQGAALIIVLAFVVLLSGLVVAYFSRTTIDRQLARASFDNTAADFLARSALEIIIGDFKQEIVNGSSTTSPPYTPNSNTDVVPHRSGDSPDVPNLIRRSVRSDTLGVPSRASALNSTDDPSANGRTVSAARWNKHYLIPRRAPVGSETATTVYTDPLGTFVSPDWVLVNNTGPAIMNSPDPSVIGRYAYAVYDEAGLLDLNVAGFPSANSTDLTYVRNIGRKGVLAFADLTATGLSATANGAIDNVVGWRNFFTAQPSGSYSTFAFPPNPTAFVTYFLELNVPVGQDKNRDFALVSVPTTYPNTYPPPRIDQAVINRAQLLELRRTLTASQDAMQYLGTFSRGINKSTWTDSGSRLSRRFPLSRFDLFQSTPPNSTNAALIQQYFGLVYVPAAGPTREHWQYNGTTGGIRQTSIPALTGTNQDPDLFRLLKYALPAASDSELLSIGASLIDQRDSDANTTWIEFGDPSLPAQKAFGVDQTSSIEPGAPAPPANPVILDRVFRNVGELGYTYRNSSTTLDFRTDNSPESALLDLFTYNTASPRCGIVNLNTRNVPVLAAVIKGAFPTESSTTGITETDAIAAADAIVSATTATPALGRQDIARLAGLVTTSPFSTDEETNETIARALAEIGEARTWGLLIDVIAQSGRYPPTATSVADFPKFVVQSEKRYWLHVAIDRISGQIIDQQLEAVYE